MNDFLAMTTVRMTKKNELDYIKIKTFYPTKDTIEKVKTTQLGKICANLLLGKGLVYPECKELFQLNDKRSLYLFPKRTCGQAQEKIPKVISHWRETLV